MAKDKAKKREERIGRKLLSALKNHPDGLTKTEVNRDVFRHGYPPEEIWAVAERLVAQGKLAWLSTKRPVIHMQPVTVLKLADGV